jgi:hypothetical protein
VVIADLAKDRQLVWPFREEGASAPNVHSMLAATLTERGSCAGFLILGSVATDLYRPADEALIRGVTPIVAIHAAAFQAQEEVGALRRTVSALEGPGGAIARAVRLLAATPALGVATQAIAAILRELTGCSSVRFILRLGASEVVTVEPGETRPLLDLPLTPIEGAAFAPVLQGQSAFLLRPGKADEQLILPLRVGAQPIGVMILTGPAGGRLAGIVFAAQQVADTVAPHLELVRREAGLEVGGASPGDLNPR